MCGCAPFRVSRWPYMWLRPYARGARLHSHALVSLFSEIMRMLDRDDETDSQFSHNARAHLDSPHSYIDETSSVGGMWRLRSIAWYWFSDLSM